jgi:asparagine synthase (glutamine-hydrolysing)
MAGRTSGTARTFSIGFGEAAFDESPYAHQVAALYRTDHRSKTVSAEAAHLLDTLAGVYDEPFGDSSALPTYQICQSAREEVTVALSGDGGDEVFAGYRRYPWHLRLEAWRTRLPQGLRGAVFGMLAALYPRMDRAPIYLRARQTLSELARGSLEGYFMSVAALGDSERRALLSQDLIYELGGFHAIEPLERAWRNAPSSEPLARAQYTDLKTWLAGDILVKVDRASMAHGLEIRSPLLDHRIAAWGIGLPSTEKIRRGQTKHVFRKALEPYLPRDLLYRPKQGFSIPLTDWIRGPMRERVEASLLDRTLLESGYVNSRRVHRMLRQHLSGRQDHGRALWLLLMFALFLERHGKQST